MTPSIKGQRLVAGLTIADMLPPMPLPPALPPDDCQPEPRNWCSRCEEYAALNMLCPVCLDRDRLKLNASRMASTCRG